MHFTYGNYSHPPGPLWPNPWHEEQAAARAESERLADEVLKDHDATRMVLGKLQSQASSLSEIEATIMVNFGRPSGEFTGGRLAQVVDERDSPIFKLVAALEWMHSRAKGPTDEAKLNDWGQSLSLLNSLWAVFTKHLNRSRETMTPDDITEAEELLSEVKEITDRHIPF